jgi:hypothetical protein
MDKPTGKPEPEEPDDLEIEKEVAEEQASKYGGRDRWLFTIGFFIMAAFALRGISQKDRLTILWVAMGIFCGIVAAINWHHWHKKSPSERAAKPASNLAAPLKIVGHPAPFARDEFSQARGALGRNLFLCAFPCLFALLGFAGALIPGKGLVERSVAAGIGIVAGWIGLYFGKQAAQQARYLGCPGCKDLLSSQSESVLLTGRCRKCGAVVLSDQPASASEPKDVAEPQIAPVPSRAASRPSATLPRKFGPDRRRLWDVVILFLFPAVCVLLLMGQKSNLGLAVFFGVMALVYSGKYYLFPDPDEPEDSSPPRKRAAQKRSAKVSDASNAETGAVAIADKTPWLDFGLILLLPVTVVVWLLYLVWTHTVLGRLGLAAATVAIPAAVVLVSWFVVQHEGHQVKKTGKPAPMTLMWGLLAIWAAAVFVFVVCLVSWIEKFGFQW